MKAPEPSEVAEEIKALKGLVDKIPQKSKFNEDNRGAVEAQITVLEKEMNEVEAIEEFEDADEYVLSSARDAAQWFEGEGEDTPSSGWIGLVK